MSDDLTKLDTDELLVMFEGRTAALKRAKEDVGAVEKVIVERMEEEGVNWLTSEHLSFTINHPRDAVNDDGKTYLTEYLGDDWPLILPLTNPRKKALRELAQSRGDDPDAVFNKVFTTKYSNKLKMAELPLDYEDGEPF